MSRMTAILVALAASGRVGKRRILLIQTVTAVRVLLLQHLIWRA